MKNWLEANGGPVGAAVVLLTIGLTLVTQDGLVQVAGWVVLGTAFLLFLFVLGPVQRRVPWTFVSRKKLSSEFWERAFEGLPFPAFVKEFPEDRHVKDNEALRRFQGRKPTEELAGTDLAALIQGDHRRGDRTAEKEGLSVQLELTDKVTTLHPRPILTLKSCIEYDGKKYVVGCYVPVTLPRLPPSGISIEVAECGGQVLFSCPSEVEGENHLVVTIGRSVRGAPSPDEE